MDRIACRAFSETFGWLLSTRETVPSEYWNIDAMNWVLVRWGQRQDTDFRSLFKRYDIYVEKHYSVSEKKKLHAYKRQFHHNLKKLLSYALEA